MDKINKNQNGMRNPKDLTGTGIKKDTNMPVPVQNLPAQAMKYKVARNAPMLAEKATQQAASERKTDKNGSSESTPSKKSGQGAGKQGVGKNIGKLYVIEGARKDLRSIGKEYWQLKNAIKQMADDAAKKDSNESGKNELSADGIVGLADASVAASKIYIKASLAGAKIPVRLCVDAAKKYFEIRRTKAELQLKNIMVNAPSPVKMNTAPKIKAAKVTQGIITVPLSEYEKSQLKKPSGGQAQLPMGTELPGDTVTDVIPSERESSVYTSRGIEYNVSTTDSTGTAVTRDVLPSDYKYDVSALEEKYGIHGSARNAEGVRAINSDVHGVKPGKGTESKTVDHTPKEITEPGKADRIKEAEKKYGVKSKNDKDNLDKSKKEKKGNKKAHKDSVAKREFKKYIVEQILLNDGDENCSSGIEALVANIGKGKAIDIAQSFFSAFGNLAKKGLKKLLWWILTTLFTIIKSVLESIISVVMALVAMIGGTVVLIVGCVCAGVLLVAGLFASFVSSGEFAVTTIDAHVSAIMEEAANYDEVNFHPYNEGRYSNYDDMLLVYLSRIADLDDDANLEGEAPFMWIDKRAERRAINAAVESMFYYKTSVRKEKRTVAVRVTCTPTPTPEPTEGSTESTTSSEPQYTIIYETVTVEITVMDIYMKSANEYMETVSKRSILENYEMLKDVFTDLGYTEFGGTTVCDAYGIDYDSSN